MDNTVMIFVIAVIVVGVLIFLAILLTGKRGHHFNVEDYQARFLAIENKLKKDNPTSFTVVILEADKLLDKALMESGLPGKTMGDRLKRAGAKFSDINAVWRVHKLRNAIAHDADFEIKYQQTFNALAIYKQALRELGAI